RLLFELPDRAHRRLETLHLGPLSFAETRELFRRLPRLDALAPNDQYRAYTDAGGHPQVLEYLDVLLRNGASRFPDIAERMEFALEKKGIRHPEAWLRQAQGNLDQALAEAVTLAVEDVLLDLLLERPEGGALARELLLGASVYRVPVDALALVWQVGEEMENLGDRPPLAVPEGFAEALAVLVSLGLLTPVALSGTPEDARFATPRRTASAVLRRGPQGPPPGCPALGLVGRPMLEPEPAGRHRAASRSPPPPPRGGGRRSGRRGDRVDLLAARHMGCLAPGRATLPGDPGLAAGTLRESSLFSASARDR